MLTYLEVHIWYNIPPLALLFLLYRPLANKADLRKYLFLCLIAVLYTTPWDNYIIYQKAWRYCPTCVMGVIGYVPIEEYIFFCTQTLLTCLLHSLFTRYFSELPALALRRHKRFPIVSCMFVVSWAVMGVYSYGITIPGTKTFYIGAILSWTAPVLCFLFTVSAISTSFLYHRWAVTVASILIPTLYLSFVDSIAICSGTWHISEQTSLEWFIWRGLPLEEGLFFLLTNTMVVLGCTCFDVAYSTILTYQQTSEFSFLALCKALMYNADEEVLEDLQHCITVLRNGSSSFYVSSLFFGDAARRDFIVLYSFCRWTDDIADSPTQSQERRRILLQEIRMFVLQYFQPQDRMHCVQRIKDPKDPNPIRRSMLRFLAHKIPREPLLELLDGYEWDLEIDVDDRYEVNTEADVIRYSNYVASSVAVMCVSIVTKDAAPHVIASARQMGVVLQLTNIARDILTDALNGRVYIPSCWFKDGERTQLLNSCKTTTTNELESDPQIKELALHRHALRLLEMAKTMYEESTDAVDELPSGARRGIRVATRGYFSIGLYLENHCKQGAYPLRARLSKSQRLALAVKTMYWPTKSELLIAGGTLLRLVLIAYGNWQDSLGGDVKYTDIDYAVFTDAARFMHNGESPYQRATYRYTPLLAWLLIPNGYFASWGKLVFAAGDIVAGWLMIEMLRSKGQKIDWAGVWLLNPMVAIISTRGNCEGLLGAVVIAMLHAVQAQRIVAAAMLTGFAVHFKIYPIIYVPSILWHLESPSSSFYDFLNRRRITFSLISALTFFALSAIMLHLYGSDYIQHTYLYHVSRTDHRHNFSPYHLLLYISSSPSVNLDIAWYTSLFAFFPQMLFSAVLIPLSYAKRNLTTTMFAQTFCFVAFNKVVTSQYFMWYMVFLPLVLPTSPLLSKTGLYVLASWIAAQAIWLFFAYGLEMLGRSTFRELWLATTMLFGLNIWGLGIVLQDSATTLSKIA